MQIKFGEKVIHEPYRKVSVLKDIIEKCVDYVFIRSDYAEDDSSAVFYRDDCISALQVYLPKNIFSLFVFTPVGDESEKVTNYYKKKYENYEDLASNNAQNILDACWPINTAWYSPIWGVKAVLVNIFGGMVDEKKSKEMMRLYCKTNVLRMFILQIEKEIEIIENTIFITKKTADRYAFFIRFRDTLKDAVMIAQNSNMTLLLDKAIPDYAVDLFALLGNYETAFKRVSGMSDEMYNQLYAKTLASDIRGPANEWLVTSGYSRTNARKTVRIAGEHSRDFLKSFMGQVGKTDLFNQISNDPQEQKFKSGHGSYLID